jgi:hypothetical protein
MQAAKREERGTTMAEQLDTENHMSDDTEVLTDDELAALDKFAAAGGLDAVTHEPSPDARMFALAAGITLPDEQDA